MRILWANPSSAFPRFAPTEPPSPLSIARNTLFMTVGKLLGSSLYIMFGLVLPGFVDTDQNGVYALMGSLLFFGSMFASFGIPVIVTRQSARFPDQAAQIFSDARLAMLLGALVSSILITIYLYSESLYQGEPMGQFWILLMLVIGIIFSDSMGSLGESLFQGFERMASPAVVEAISGLVRAGGATLALILLPQDYRILGVFCMFLLGSALRGWILSHWVHNKLLPSVTIPKSTVQNAWRMMKTSGFVAVFRILRMLRNRIDILLMGFLWVSLVPNVEGDVQSARGLYSQAMRVAAIFLTFTMAFNTAIFPRLSRLTGGDPESLASDRAATKNLYGRALRWQAFWVVPMAVGIFFYTNTVVGWFGDKYLYGDLENGVVHSTAQVLKVLLIAMIADCISGPAGMLFLGVKELERKVPMVAGVVLAISVVCNIILIPRHGILGAAWASAISASAEFILKMTLIGLGFGNPIRILLRTIPYYFVAAAMFALLYFLNLGDKLLIGAPLGAAFYILVCYFMGLIDPSVVKIIRNKLGRA